MIRAFILALALTTPAIAQDGAGVQFGGGSGDQQVEVSADSLSINQAAGTAEFTGNVVIIQGDLRLGAPRVTVRYGDGGEVTQAVASGGVTMSDGTDAAEAQSATYDVTADRLVMEGDVLLTQGPGAVTGGKLTLNLASGTGQMTGGVRTVFNVQ